MNIVVARIAQTVDDHQRPIAIRLYDEDDHLNRPEFTEPEIQRTNLAAVILQMKALKLGRIEKFPFIDPPDSRFVKDGYRLLRELQALDARDQLTDIGRKLARLPLDPLIVRWWYEVGGTAVTFGSDAHTEARVGFGFREAAAMAEAAGFQPGADRLDPWLRRRRSPAG